MAPDSIRQRFIRWKLGKLLTKYSGLRLTSTADGSVKIAGALAFVAEAPGKTRIADEYEVELVVPNQFPDRIPVVREIGGRIPRSFHKLNNAELCLGAPTRLQLIVAESPSVLRFVERCVIPYLYGYSHFERHGVMPFGELKHGAEGVREDLASLFGTERAESVGEFVRLTAMREATRQQAGMSVRQRATLGPMSPPADQHAPRTARAPLVLDYLTFKLRLAPSMA